MFPWKYLISFFFRKSHKDFSLTGNLPTHCLSVLDHFVKLALKGLKNDLLFVSSECKKYCSTRSAANYAIFAKLYCECKFKVKYRNQPIHLQRKIDDRFLYDLNIDYNRAKVPGRRQQYLTPCYILYRNQSFGLHYKSNDWFLYEMQFLAELSRSRFFSVV